MKKYIIEIHQIDKKYGFLTKFDEKENLKISSYEDLYFNQEILPQESLNQDNIKELLHNTQLIDDQFYQIKKTDNQKAKESGISISNEKNLTKNLHNSNSFIEFQNNTFIQGDYISNGNNKFKSMNSSLDKINEEKESENDKELELKTKCLSHYKIITEKIEKQLKDVQNNALGFLKQCFIIYFSNKYEKLLINDKKYCNLTEKTYDDYLYKSKSCNNDFKEFVKLFQELITKFYKINEYKKYVSYFLFTNDNLYNYITSILFDETISTLITEIQRKIDQKSVLVLEKQMPTFINFRPQDFEISEKYCLNEKTLNYILRKKIESTENQKNYIDFQSNTLSLDKNGRRSTVYHQQDLNEERKIQELSNSIYDEETLKLNRYNPYQKSIKSLKRVCKLKSPLHKLKQIINTSKIILQEINEFYDEHFYKFDETLGGDEMLSIYVYIVAKTEIPKLITECAIIDKFITSNLTNSIYGYYLVTIQVCLRFLSSFRPHSIEESKPNEVSSLREFLGKN